MQFNKLITFLQNLPTQKWGEDHINILIAEGFSYMMQYDDN